MPVCKFRKKIWLAHWTGNVHFIIYHVIKQFFQRLQPLNSRRLQSHRCSNFLIMTMITTHTHTLTKTTWFFFSKYSKFSSSHVKTITSLIFTSMEKNYVYWIQMNEYLVKIFSILNWLPGREKKTKQKTFRCLMTLEDYCNWTPICLQSCFSLIFLYFFLKLFLHYLLSISEMMTLMMLHIWYLLFCSVYIKSHTRTVNIDTVYSR